MEAIGKSTRLGCGFE